ncbi:unnamed protein product [Leuciscus chuanchicus]
MRRAPANVDVLQCSNRPISNFPLPPHQPTKRLAPSVMTSQGDSRSHGDLTGSDERHLWNDIPPPNPPQERKEAYFPIRSPAEAAVPISSKLPFLGQGGRTKPPLLGQGGRSKLPFLNLGGRTKPPLLGQGGGSKLPLFGQGGHSKLPRLRGNIFEYLQSPVHALLARPWLPAMPDTSFSIDIPEILSHSAGIPETFFSAGPPDINHSTGPPEVIPTAPSSAGYLDVSSSASSPEPSLSASSPEASRSASSPTVSLPESLLTAGLPESLLAACPTDALQTLGLGLTLSASSQAASLSTNSPEATSSAGYPDVARSQVASHFASSAAKVKRNSSLTANMTRLYPSFSSLLALYSSFQNIGSFFILQQLWSLGKHHLKSFGKGFKDNVNIFELRRTEGETNAERRRERFRKETTGE